MIDIKIYMELYVLFFLWFLWGGCEKECGYF